MPARLSTGVTPLITALQYSHPDIALALLDGRTERSEVSRSELFLRWGLGHSPRLENEEKQCVSWDNRTPANIDTTSPKDGQRGEKSWERLVQSGFKFECFEIRQYSSTKLNPIKHVRYVFELIGFTSWFMFISLKCIITSSYVRVVDSPCDMCFETSSL